MEKLYISKIPHSDFPCELDAQMEAFKDNAQMMNYAQYRENMKSDPFEPTYHFSAPHGMINDPNGLCFWQGMYHMFYQAYPAEDPRQHWGHAISDDLVTWKDLPLAIYPDIEYASYSGSALVENDRVIAMYHGRGVGNMIATSTDPLLLNWEKNKNCPVIPLMPNSDTGIPYRVFDPFIWKEDEGYYALSGTYFGMEENHHKGKTNRMVEHVFFSQDLSRWTYIGQLMDDNPYIEIGNDGACPYFWPVGDKHVLFFFSHQSGPHCLVGNYDKLLHKFTPQKHIKLNFGPVGCSNLHAPCAMPDGQGGVYVVYNTKDANRSIFRQGMMSVMRHVTMSEDGKIKIQPVKQIENLRDSHYNKNNIVLKPFEEQVMDCSGKSIEISAKLDMQDARAITLNVLRSTDKKEFTSITIYKSEMKRGNNILKKMYLTIDTTRSSLLPEPEGRIPETTEFELKSDELIDLRVFVDKSIVEVFLNKNTCLMQMVYPSKEDSCSISFEAIGRQAKISSFDVWKMKSIY